MSPTLPTELIKRILELVYEGVREVETIPPPDTALTCHLDGEHVAHIFHPFLFVSKTFHALALPFLVRHLFARPFVATEELQQAHHKTVTAFVPQHSLGAHVQSIVIPSSMLQREQSDLVRACSALKALDLRHRLASSSLLSLPATITTLSLQADNWTLTYQDLVDLQRSTPQLKVLGFGGESFGVKLELTEDQEDEYENLDLPWRLEKLDLGNLKGSAIPIFSWLRDSASTLHTLSTRFVFLRDRGGHAARVIDYPLEEMHHPLPALVNLAQSAPFHDPSRANPLTAETLPNLATLDISLYGSALVQLRNTTATLRRAHLSLLDDEDLPLDDAEAVRELSAFITNHPSLELLALEYPVERDEERRAQGLGVWSEPLEALCAERGIVFACNDHALKVDKGDEAYEPDDAGSFDDESSVGSSGIEEEMDFDAEDDEIWAREWSEEKREAMGLGPQVEVEEVNSAEG